MMHQSTSAAGGRLAKLILGRFPDAVLPDFSRFPAGFDDYLNVFFTDPRHGRYCGRDVPVTEEKIDWDGDWYVRKSGYFYIFT